MPNPSSDNPISALKASYRLLPEETKRRISRTFFERRPDDFAMLAKWAKTGYYNVRIAAQRPAGVGAKLDDYLMRSQNGYNLLRQSTNYFFCAEKTHWVDFVRSRAHQQTPATVAAKVSEILAAPDAPWRGDPLELGANNFDHAGRYNAMAEFASAFVGKTNLRFTTKKHWFQVIDAKPKRIWDSRSCRQCF